MENWTCNRRSNTLKSCIKCLASSQRIYLQHTKYIMASLKPNSSIDLRTMSNHLNMRYIKRLQIIQWFMKHWKKAPFLKNNMYIISSPTYEKQSFADVLQNRFKRDWKETTTQKKLSCEIFEILKATFYRTPRVAPLKGTLMQVLKCCNIFVFI